ncbi:MAG: hypothetical protein LBU20_01865 [Candidatus Nomurabacteria bacterium]|jgi:DNA polymerase-3 subunit delta|nr:hypothetical protein [Candidatus Nomurabacteria bacterium]
MIHFYYGADDLALGRQLRAVKAAFAAKHGAENISQIDTAEADADKILAELVNIGLFATQRLVVLRAVFSNKFLSDKLPEVLPRIPDETEVVIAETKPDKRLKLYKVLVKDYRAKEFSDSKDNVGFTLSEAATQAVKISRAGAEELVRFTNGDRWAIVSELEKLAGISELVTPEIVHRYVEPELEVSAFNLLENLLNGRKAEALAELGKLRIKEDANRFFGLLASQIFGLSAVVHAGKRAPSEIAKDISLHPYVVQKLAKTKATKADLKKYSKIISETDEKLKTAKTEAWTLVELALAKF